MPKKLFEGDPIDRARMAQAIGTLNAETRRLERQAKCHHVKAYRFRPDSRYVQRSAEGKLIKKEVFSIIYNSLQQLDSRRAYIIERHDLQGATYEQIQRELPGRISREWVRGLRNSGMWQLRNILTNKYKKEDFFP